ncbi:MAG: fibrillarin-like rRNA/tRNA 2'-O-methyltransferase [Nitrososphaerota archaeon]|jgi:fibrillarin-like pre-rRNA processing protein|nr:fibrillarin-like rRNA/tRNA 2'-O-methyltransferase [Nitrososphaerota archaeon]MDG6941942.1 fibrillarin-like rRNA/tRNA 2'-O-methyltransferase [Nitrososphaerota archaeon]
MSRLLKEERLGRKALLTRNLVPGKRVYNEDLLQRGGAEYRTWDPFRSKLAAAMIKGLPDSAVGEGAKVLYLGASTGTTVSHVSDLVGPGGLVVGVEFSPRVAREFIEKVARERGNVIPFVADARDPSKYSVAKFDVVYCDIAQPDQTEIALANCAALLKPGGTLLLVVKARSIDVLKDPERVFIEEEKKLRAGGFDVKSVTELSPFEKDHALIHAVMDSEG